MLLRRRFTLVGAIAFFVSACAQHGTPTSVLPQSYGAPTVRTAFSDRGDSPEDASAPTVTWQEFKLPTGYTGPTHITSAPKKKHKLWFTEYGANAVGVITTKGKISEHALFERVPGNRSGPAPMVTIPPSGNAPYGITVGSDENVWFGDEYLTTSSNENDEIGRIKRKNIVQYGVSAPCCLQNLVLGPDGDIWFPVSDNYQNMCTSANYIGKITTSGAATLYELPNATCPYNVTVGPKKDLWFTEFSSNSIGEMTTSGSLVHTFALSSGAGPEDITLGPDKALWFTECTAHKIGRITTAGKLTEYKLHKKTYPGGITVGPDDALWFTEPGKNALGRITTTGKIKSYTIPTKDSDPFFITLGSDGALWFTEYNANKIGRVQVKQ
jgi:virginiamycin B lyase